MPLDDRSARIFEGLLPVLEAGLVLLVLAPAQLDLADGVATANQIVVAHLGNTGCSLHIVFSRFFKKNPASVNPRCQCVYTHQAGRKPALQQHWQSSEKSQNAKEKAQ